MGIGVSIKRVECGATWNRVEESVQETIGDIEQTLRKLRRKFKVQHKYIKKILKDKAID